MAKHGYTLLLLDGAGEEVAHLNFDVSEDDWALYGGASGREVREVLDVERLRGEVRAVCADGPERRAIQQSPAGAALAAWALGHVHRDLDERREP